MKRQTSKQKVRAVYPNAIVIEDTDVYPNSDWAATAKFAIGFFNGPMNIDPNKIYQTTYAFVTESNTWEFLCGWKENPTVGWKSAWESIAAQMIRKLEQQ
jgi:hypothetical protein